MRTSVLDIPFYNPVIRRTNSKPSAPFRSIIGR